MTELLDIYDENGNHLGIKERRAVHLDGDWHRVFHCWVVYRDQDGVGHVVAQKRSSLKDTAPNLIYVTAAGHYLAGETIKDGIREIEEELGIGASFDDLISVGRRVDIARHGQLIDHEISDVFLLVHNRPIQEYKLQVEEVAGIVSFRVDEGIELFAGERSTLTAEAVGLGRPRIELQPSDFVPRVDAYVYKILLLVRRYFLGDRQLLI